MSVMTTPRREMNPFAPVEEPARTFCAFHGGQGKPYCPDCDGELGIDREAEKHRAEREAVLATLMSLGFSKDSIAQLQSATPPAPNEAKQALTVAEQRAELEARLAALPEEGDNAPF